MITIVPVYTEISKDNFVDSLLVTPREVNLHQDFKVLTAPLLFDKEISLLGISQTSDLVEAGIIDPTDILDHLVGLEKVYIETEEYGVVELPVSALPYSVFVLSPANQFRMMQQNGVFLVPVNDTQWVEFETSGCAILETGNIRMSMSILRTEGLNIDKVRPLGYDIYALRCNCNPGQESIPANDFNTTKCEESKHETKIGFTKKIFKQRKNMKFRGYRPGFIDSDEPIPEFEFNTREELVKSEWVGRFSKDYPNEPFHQFSVSPPRYDWGSQDYTLMSERQKGKSCSVVGFISGGKEEIASLNLPTVGTP